MLIDFDERTNQIWYTMIDDDDDEGAILIGWVTWYMMSSKHEILNSVTCFKSLRSRLATVANTKLPNLSLDRHISEPKISRLLFSQRTFLRFVLSNFTLYWSPFEVHTGYSNWTSLYTRMSCRAPILAEPIRSNNLAIPSRRGLTKSSRRSRNCTSK